MSPTGFLLRLISIALTLFGVAVVVFVVIRLVPGDPIAMMLPPGATDADIDRLRALYGLDKSIPEQFLIWLSGVVQGDFGTSISLRQDVAGLVLRRLPATLELAALSLLFATLIGGTLAVIGTIRRGGRTEGGIDVWNGLALSTPDFLWGLALILVFGVFLQWFGVSGRVSPQLDLPFVTQFYLLESLARLRLDLTGDLLAHMLMPALALALPLSAMHGADAETVAEGGHGSRLRAPGPHQGLFRARGDLSRRRCATPRCRRWRSSACSSPS